MNKKILLVVDKRNWAYDHMATFIMKELSDHYTFHKMIAYYHVNNNQGMIRKFLKQIYNFLRCLFFESYNQKIDVFFSKINQGTEFSLGYALKF